MENLEVEVDLSDNASYQVWPKGTHELLSPLCVRHRRLLTFYIFIFFSETTEQISSKLGRNVRQVVLYQICADWKINMAAILNFRSANDS